MTNREFFLKHSTAEFTRFVGVFEALPADQLEYRPHPRSRSAYELIGHMIGHEDDLLELLETGKINHRVQVPFKTLSDAIGGYRAAHAAVEQKIGSMSDAAWESPCQFIINGSVAYDNVPRRDLAWLLHFDALHHRGQLSTY